MYASSLLHELNLMFGLLRLHPVCYPIKVKEGGRVDPVSTPARIVGQKPNLITISSLRKGASCLRKDRAPETMVSGVVGYETNLQLCRAIFVRFSVDG